jgi:hypothetical protein
MLDVRKLRRLLELAVVSSSEHASLQVVPLARYLRPFQQYALPLSQPKPHKGESQ